MGFAFDVGCWTFSVRRFSAHSGRVAEPGLRHSTRNRACGDPPWVRIPPLPLALRKEQLAKESALFRQDWRVATSSSYVHLELAHLVQCQFQRVRSSASSS